MTSTQVDKSQEAFVLPASFAQQRLWFLDRLEPDRAVYNVPLATRFRGPLDVDVLARSLRELAERHESLRTVFTVVDEVPHQLILPSSSIELQVTDLSGLPDPEQRASALVDEQVRTPFDLAAGPLVRASLLKLGADDHVLVLTAHHIVVDAWSMSVLNRELSALYAASVDGVEAELPELSIQYGDYAVWQQEWMRSGGLDQQLDYWKQQLAGAPTLLELPTDRPRPPRQSYRGATVRTMLSTELLKRVRELGEREGATAFMTLLAVFASLLSRYSGQEDIVVASPVANRGRVELEGVIGLFVNTLALRVDLGTDPSFIEVLHRVRETALAAFSNQDLPFEKVVGELNPERRLSHAPMAQVLFVLQNAVERPVAFPGLSQERVLTERGTAKFDLSFFAADTPEGLRLSMEYSTDLFDAATAARMLSHFGNLLESALSDPTRPVSQLRMLDEEERRAALDTWSATGVTYPVACMHELFERRAAEHPGAIAATFEGASISYGELNRAANRLARRLRSLGARQGTMVALLLEPSPEMLTAILGVLKAGAAYVPLDPEHPADRLAFVLEDTRAPIVVTTAHLRDRVPSETVQTVSLDPEDESLAAESTTDLEWVGSPNDLAYVIYTSGSTGQPKGVQVEHRQVARLFSATDAWFGFGPADTWMLLHSYAFDFSVWELWGALAHGGRLVIVPRLTARTPRALAELVADQQVTVMNATPSLFRTAQEELLRAAHRMALRLVIFGGEALHPPALRPWFDRFGDQGPALVNMYGITETTVHVTYRPLRAADCDAVTSPIGLPIPDLSLYLLDPGGEPVPQGVLGELYVGGAGVTRGYLNRAELTPERFVANPFGPGRLYRTGDVARALPGGELDFRGRTDDQVKIRGFRIELGEIQAAITAHPRVTEAAVLASRSEEDDPRLAAYVVPAEAAQTPGADGLRAFLAERLPGYMIPAAWVFLDGLPLTRNGKLDSKALPAPEYNRSAAAKAFVAPSTTTEQQLARIWSDVLEVAKIGVHDSFFELGGHSMLAVRVFAEIERKLGVQLPLSALFETPTIAGLAELIERDRREGIDWSLLVPLRPGAAHDPMFFIGWAGGEVLPYRDLVENLDSEMPVFGLRAPGADGRTQTVATVEELAARYIREIRQVQPTGPYNLLGYCFSGLVAYEMAGQLLAEGEEIGLLALLDAYPYKVQRRRRTFEIERSKLMAFKEASLRGKREWIGERRTAAVNRVRDRVYDRTAPRLYELLESRNLVHLMPRRPWNLVLVASSLARRRYQPRPLPVRIEFFRAQPVEDARPTPWEKLAGRGVRLTQIVAEGINHERMMHEPHVRQLAAALSRAMAGRSL